MTHSHGHLREQFEALTWSVSKRQPASTNPDSEDVLSPQRLCAALRGSTDQVPSGAPFDALDRMLEKIDAMPKRRTYGAYAYAVRKLLKVAA